MKLNNGYAIPVPGFGTFKTPDGEICIDAVREAEKTWMTPSISTRPMTIAIIISTRLMPAAVRWLEKRRVIAAIPG